MHLKVVKVGDIQEKLRYDQTKQRQAEVLVGDQYGVVNMKGRDEQLDIIKEGAVITVRNCHAKVVKEHIRLEVDKWGKVEKSDVKIDSVNTEKNLSDVEYELAPVGRR